MPATAVGEAFAPLDLQLRDGRRVTLRAITPQDKDALQAAWQGLSAESRYSRVMAPLRELSPKMLDKATSPPERELGLVAVVGAGAQEAIVGAGRYVAVAGSQDCEFAVTVADDWQRAGLARRLMEVLMTTAKARGFTVMEGYVLTSNAGMRALAARLGFSDEPMPGDPTVRIVRRDLRAAA